MCKKLASKIHRCINPFHKSGKVKDPDKAHEISPDRKLELKIKEAVKEGQKEVENRKNKGIEDVQTLANALSEELDEIQRKFDKAVLDDDLWNDLKNKTE